MNDPDVLQELIIEFFGLPPQTSAEALTQKGIEKWDSLAMVQLIMELQSKFGVRFDLEELDQLQGYAEIKQSLLSKGVRF